MSDRNNEEPSETAQSYAVGRGWQVQPDSDTQSSESALVSHPSSSGASEATEVTGATTGASTDVTLDVTTGGSEPDAAPQLSSVALMLLGVFGGLALLYTWGWLEIARAYSLVNENTATGSGIIGGILQQVTFWVAPLAPAAWLLAGLAMTRGRGPTRLALVLALGAIVTLPYPMIVGGAA